MSLKDRSEAQHLFGNFTGLLPVASPNNFIIPAPPSGVKRTAIYRLLVTVGAATVLTVQSSDGTNVVALSQGFNLGVTGGIALDVPFNYDPWWIGGNGLGVTLASSISVTVGWDIWWLYVPAGQGTL